MDRDSLLLVVLKKRRRVVRGNSALCLSFHVSGVTHTYTHTLTHTHTHTHSLSLHAALGELTGCSVQLNLQRRRRETNQITETGEVR